jgi:hypothetical protein
MRNLIRVIALISAITAFTAIAAVAQGNGKITGKLTYPSEFIPSDMAVCVESPERTVCSNSRNKAGYVFKVNRASARYEVSLPPGKYYIYAKTREMPGEKAYYNEFVRCGMNVRCKSKRLIRITVRSGRTVSGITLGDWYP